MSPTSPASIYWQRVAQEAEILPPPQDQENGIYFLTSERRLLQGPSSDPTWKAGVVCQVGGNRFHSARKMAARLVLEGTHRLSTLEEIAAFRAAQERAVADLRLQEAQRNIE